MGDVAAKTARRSAIPHTRPPTSDIRHRRVPVQRLQPHLRCRESHPRRPPPCASPNDGPAPVASRTPVSGERGQYAGTHDPVHVQFVVRSRSACRAWRCPACWPRAGASILHLVEWSTGVSLRVVCAAPAINGTTRQFARCPPSKRGCSPVSCSQVSARVRAWRLPSARQRRAAHRSPGESGPLVALDPCTQTATSGLAVAQVESVDPRGNRCVPCTGQFVLGVVDVLDRVSEASAACCSAAPCIAWWRGDRSVGRWPIGREQQERCVDTQDSPFQQPGHDRCFDHDSL
jgi:hypothetical protein